MKWESLGAEETVQNSPSLVKLSKLKQGPSFPFFSIKAFKISLSEKGNWWVKLDSGSIRGLCHRGK